MVCSEIANSFFSAWSGDALSRNGFLEPNESRDADTRLGVLGELVTGDCVAKVLPKWEPGPVSWDGSGAFSGSSR
jgi:hypothetical protein